MVSPMRFLTAALVLATAAPAAAQPILMDDLRAQQEAANRRAIDQSNQLMAMEARLRAEQGVAELQRPAPRPPEFRYKPAAGGFTRALPPNYPAVPDDALAQSNKRVQDATRNRR